MGSFLTRAYICITMSHEAKKGPISRVDCSLVTTVCGIPDASMHIMPVLLQMHGDRNCDVCMWHASNSTAPKTPGCLRSQRRDWLWEATEVQHHCSIGSPSRTKLPQHQTVPLTVLKTPCPFCVPLQAVLKNPCRNVSCTQDPVPNVFLFI